MTVQPKVLVVDDEENISFLVASALKLDGCEVRVAATGRDAVDATEKFAPDAIVLDVMLPDFDGFEVLRRIRNSGSEAPVLFLTARDDTDDKVRGLMAGGDDYIVKPFVLEELIARVQVQLRRRGSSPLSSRLQVHDLVIDDDAHRVWRGDNEVFLGHGVPAAVLSRVECRKGSIARADPRSCVALRLRWRVIDYRVIHVESSKESRQR